MTKNNMKTDIFAGDMSSRNELIDRLKHKTRVLKTPEIEEALRAVDRRDFVRDDLRVEAYEDYPLPIPAGQTISQPTTVVFMLELLELAEGQRVLDVGCGSGWTTALLAHIVGESGQVIGLEVQEELVEFGRQNLETYHFPQAEIRKTEGGIPTQPEAPFDRILVSAAMPELTDELIENLKENGIAVASVRDAIVKVTKDSEDEITTETYSGFSFVPFRE